MTESATNLGKDLNTTFLPQALLRKIDNKANSTLHKKYQFQKTSGNAFISIDPPQLKFAGYQLDKSYTAAVRIINRAPIPQRITVIPPESPSFSIKNYKKGSIASGMSETITVVFRSSQFKYQTDVVSIRTQTQNFVVPLYAYPTLPDLRTIFPKMIDFGAVQCKEPTTYFYPITNSVPLNFEFEFHYQKQSQQISINPLKGIIPASQTLTIQITFMPVAKFTSIAQVFLMIQQFDFQPLPIKIVGSGAQKPSLNQSKRIKSSKLAPLKDGEESRKTPQPLLKRPSRESQRSSVQSQNLAATGTINAAQTGPITMKKTNIRTGFPKLMSAKRTLMEEESKPLNPAKVAERQYLSRFNRVQELDKEKQIKFSQFLGDKAMTEEELEFQKQLVQDIQKARMKAMENQCTQRYNPESGGQVAVQFKIVPQKTVTWDDKQNDQHLNRRKALLRFMNAGTKVILKYRMLKRLAKIQQFIGNCTTRQQVKKLVDESHAKALDQQQGITIPENFQLDFNLDSIHPTYFELQFEDGKEKQNNVQLQPQGKTSFDDLTQLKEVLPHNMEKYKFGELPQPGDFFYNTSVIPPPRQSGQQQYFYKTSALDSYQPESPTSAYLLPIKVPAHHFIYNDQSIKHYQNYITCDEKDPQINLQNNQPVQDEFQGWTGGQLQILKYRFSRNLGCPYTSFSGFNFSHQNKPLPPQATLGQDLPRLIENPSFQDTIEAGDSDQQNLEQTPTEPAHKFIDQIQATNADLKERRAKGEIRNPEKPVIQMLQSNLQKQQQKGVGECIGRLMEANKFVEHPQHRFLL